MANLTVIDCHQIVSPNYFHRICIFFSYSLYFYLFYFFGKEKTNRKDEKKKGKEND